ncbi:MAG TPA: alpha/beta hydrolase-fold protein [Phycisphaerae bacterium]|nr:alpha/beta hydrolase-fold protein [Phycisphaerae bacterium]HRW54644.1 alpha/beta hydrolase-fold protein [Phycisphaerae bacterium]
MPQRILAAITLLSTFASAGAFPIRFVVSVPENTPDKPIYIVGSHPNLGEWRPDAVFITRNLEGRYEITLDLPAGDYEYKFTRGGWPSVEKSETNTDVPNRTLKVTGPMKVEVKVANWAGVDPVRKSTVTGELRFHKDVTSRFLPNARTIAVWLPPGYDTDAERRYPVFYMHDGQNLFDAATSAFGVEWRADETADRLIREKKIEPIIIVGAWNTQSRTDEYTPDRDTERDAGGQGDNYAKFIIEELKPMIDRTYRTKPDRDNTAIGGSSLGGLISLHIAMEHPDVFSKCAAVSPTLMWEDDAILKRIREIKAKPLRRIRLWFDMGAKEGGQIDFYSTAMRKTDTLESMLRKAKRKPDVDYKYLKVDDGEHNEASWAKRFDQILLFLFPADPSTAANADNAQE